MCDWRGDGEFSGCRTPPASARSPRRLPAIARNAIMIANGSSALPSGILDYWNGPAGRFNPAIPFSFLPFLQFQCALYLLVLPVGIVITDTHQNSPLRRLF